ncbi:MAG: PD40 domain-containing protein [Planctomycetes bacterium]|nr:PD40 domain-containing protein [Planctomycetota bacterium]
MFHRLAASLSGFVFLPSLMAFPQTTTAVSVDPNGLLGDGASLQSRISADGRFVAFSSAARNLVAGDANGAVDDVFVRDLQTGVTTLESVNSAGVQADDVTEITGLSADGRWLVLKSFARNIDPNDMPQSWDTFLRDRAAGTTILLSQGGAIPRGYSNYDGDASFSSDGSWVVFEVTNYLFVRDLATGATQFVSVADDGTPATGIMPSISADGRWVAFMSIASNCVAGDTNSQYDVFVHDRDPDGNGTYDDLPRIATNLRVSTDAQGFEVSSNSGTPTISDDGRYVCFWSDSPNLVFNDSNGARDVFVRDRDADGNGHFDDVGGVSLVRVSVSSTGAEAMGSGAFASASSTARMMTRDARFVLFDSYAVNLVSGDTNQGIDVFLHDRDADGNGIFDEPGGIATTLESVSTTGAQSVQYVGAGGVSEDGRSLTFASDSAGLVPGDQNRTWDVFLRSVPGRVTPALGSVTPSLGVDRGGDHVEVHGTNLSTFGTHVDFGGAPAAIVSSSATTLVVRTPPGFGTVDVRVSDLVATATLPAAFTYVSEDVYARYGNVNVARGIREDVLLVNAVTGDPLLRTVAVAVGMPIRVTLLSPSSRTFSPFAIYGWRGSPGPSTLAPQPFGVGSMVFATPLDAGAAVRPAWIANNLDPRLGSSSGSFPPAPTTLVNLSSGRSRSGTVTLQGFVRDDASASSHRVSVTNAVILRIR